MNIQYIRVGDYFIPDLELPEEPRPIGKWGRMHRDYLRENKPIRYNCLLLSGRLWTYLADLDEQAQDRLEQIIDQMKATEGITEALKASDPMAWVQHMNNIRTRAEEIVRVLYRPLYMKNPNFFPTGNGFGFLIFIKDITY